MEVGDASDEDSIRYMERQLCRTEEQKKERMPLIRLAVEELTNGRPALVNGVVEKVQRGASYTGTCCFCLWYAAIHCVTRFMVVFFSLLVCDGQRSSSRPWRMPARW